MAENMDSISLVLFSSCAELPDSCAAVAAKVVKTDF